MTRTHRPCQLWGKPKPFGLCAGSPSGIFNCTANLIREASWCACPPPPSMLPIEKTLMPALPFVSVSATTETSKSTIVKTPDVPASTRVVMLHVDAHFRSDGLAAFFALCRTDASQNFGQCFVNKFFEVHCGSPGPDEQCKPWAKAALLYWHHGLGVGGHLVCPQANGTARFSLISIAPTSRPSALSVPQRLP